MKVFKHDNEIEIAGVSDFDLAKTFECGQCFRWNITEKDANTKGNNGHSAITGKCDGAKNAYIGVAFGHAARLRRCNDSVFISGSLEDFESLWRTYFDLDRDYSEIRHQFCIDDFMKQATAFGKGIRLLRQDKWEALCSFIISQNNNIPRIKSIIETLCREFGEVLNFENHQLYTFPSAITLASLKVEHLAPLRCGYRSEYIIRSAKMVADGAIDLDALAKSTPDAARSELKKLHGVGDKVADCVLLFGLHMLDAFPLDVWMKKAVDKHYGSDFDPSIFSPYAGIAQQYIFHYMRTGL